MGKHHEDVNIEGTEGGFEWTKFFTMGTIVGIDKRERGSAMIWMRAGGRQESKVEGAPIDTWFTPVIPIRIPAYVVDNIPENVLVRGELVIVEGRLQGIKRRVENRDFYTVEVQASRVSKGLPDMPHVPSEE